jgi:hypothetical protein
LHSNRVVFTDGLYIDRQIGVAVSISAIQVEMRCTAIHRQRDRGPSGGRTCLVIVPVINKSYCHQLVIQNAAILEISAFILFNDMKWHEMPTLIE